MATKGGTGAAGAQGGFILTEAAITMGTYTVLIGGAVFTYYTSKEILRLQELARSQGMENDNYNSVVTSAGRKGKKRARDMLTSVSKMSPSAICPNGFRKGGKKALAGCKTGLSNMIQSAYSGGAGVAYTLYANKTISPKEYPDVRRNMIASKVKFATKTFENCLKDKVCCPSE